MQSRLSSPSSNSTSSIEDDDSVRERRQSKLNSLVRSVSPPKRKSHGRFTTKSATAAVEAGEKHVEDHLTFYSGHLLPVTLPEIVNEPRISHRDWIDLYKRNAGNERGSHFVIHQHDHPVAGTHYDLRLQCNPTSSISFAIMYGLPGDPNSIRLNRNATETRVHCLWNHLIETASNSTGSMLLWDTGEYEVLPHDMREDPGFSDDSDDQSRDNIQSQKSEQQKLHQAFSQRKIRLRLHGTKLPLGYTLSVRLTMENFRDQQPGKPSRRRRHKIPAKRPLSEDSNSDDSSDTVQVLFLQRTPSSATRFASPPPTPDRVTTFTSQDNRQVTKVDVDDEEEIIRQNNAYKGAVNDIGSIHQRRWYLSLDRPASGFVKKILKDDTGIMQTIWIPRKHSDKLDNHSETRFRGFAKFHVLGRDTERSILTGRLAKDILKDEGIDSYVPRGLWRPVTE